MATILITGSSSGIGMATALELGRAGHKVYATMRNPSKAPELSEQTRSERLPISILKLDVDSDQSVAACFAAVRQQDSEIDVLINNAGIEHHASIEELPIEAFRSVMETNYFGALRCIREVLPRMRERRSGCIINVTSLAGKISSSPLGVLFGIKVCIRGLERGTGAGDEAFRRSCCHCATRHYRHTNGTRRNTGTAIDLPSKQAPSRIV
jgi:NAD(P)-dependent dehydrogenase (short-subunit alcohol dehydrogenase family)